MSFYAGILSLDGNLFFQVRLCISLPTMLLFYRKDNSGGHSSNACTDDKFFVVFSRSTFLKKKQDNKQIQTNLVKNFIENTNA